MRQREGDMTVSGGARSARRGWPIAVAAVALALGGLAAITVAGRPGPGPVLATVALGSSVGLPAIGVDEVVGRAYVVANSRSSAGPQAATVRVLNTATGALVGTAALPGQTGGEMVMVVDTRRGRVYVASSGGTSCSSTGSGSQTCTATSAAFVALDARTGQSLHTLPVDAGRGLALDGRTGLLYALPSGGTVGGGAPTLLRAIDGRSGRIVRAIVLPGDAQGGGFGALALDGSVLVAVRVSFGRPGALRASADVVDLARGRLVGHIALPGAGFVVPYRPSLVDAARGRAYISLGAYGAVAGQVEVIDTRRATLLRATTTGRGLGSIVQDTRMGRVYTTALGAFRTITTRTRGGGAATTQAPTGVGGLRVLDARSGALVRSVPIGLGATGVAVDERRGRVYALSIGPADARGGLTRPGTLSVVNERSGQVVRTLAVGAVPLTLALDRRHDRLLVGCAGAFGGTPDDPWGWVPGQVRHLLPFLPRPPAPISTPQGSVLVLDTTRL